MVDAIRATVEASRQMTVAPLAAHDGGPMPAMICEGLGFFFSKVAGLSDAVSELIPTRRMPL